MRLLLSVLLVVLAPAVAAQPTMPGTCAPGTATGRLPGVPFAGAYFANDGSFVVRDTVERFSPVRHSGIWIGGVVGGEGGESTGQPGTSGAGGDGAAAPGGAGGAGGAGARRSTRRSDH